MRTTLNTGDELIEAAARLTDMSEKTASGPRGTRSVIERAEAKRLGELGGTQPDLKPSPCCRPPQFRNDAP